MRLDPGELAALLRSHSFVRIEQPEELWPLECAGLDPFVRLLGEMIAAGLVRNGVYLAALTLGVANVVVGTDAAGVFPAGEYVAMSVTGAGGWADAQWPTQPLAGADLTRALDASGAVAAYTRDLGDATGAQTGSVTALFRRGQSPV